MQIGQLIKAMRKRAGMTQRELAKAAKITAAGLCRIEKDQVGQAKISSLDGIANALGTTLVGILLNVQAKHEPSILADDFPVRLAAIYHRLDARGRKTLIDVAKAIEKGQP